MTDAEKKETPEEKFKRLAESRVTAVLQKIKVLSNLAKPPYKFSEEQVDRIFSAIRTALDEIEDKFKKRGKRIGKFSLE